jgi:hypothetical protein
MMNNYLLYQLNDEQVWLYKLNERIFFHVSLMMTIFCCLSLMMKTRKIYHASCLNNLNVKKMSFPKKNPFLASKTLTNLDNDHVRYQAPNALFLVRSHQHFSWSNGNFQAILIRVPLLACFPTLVGSRLEPPTFQY